jgi:hypothetical protein
MKLLLALIGAALCCTAQPQYRFVSLMNGDLERFAQGSRVNDSGVVIGRVNSSGSPAVFSPQFGVIIPPMVSQISAINSAGDIVGQSSAGQPFVAVPPYTSIIDLSTVFGWLSGTAVGINDRGDIIATGEYAPPNGSGIAVPYTFDAWFPGLNISVVTGINNARQVIGVTSTASPQTYLYTPGQGSKLLAGGAVLTNGGGMLVNISGAVYIQTATGQIPLPAGYTWLSMNDSDEVVGIANSGLGSFYYSVSTGLVNLSQQVINSQAYSQFSAFGINNNGEIAVNYQYAPNPAVPGAIYAGVGLLVPVTPAQNVRTRLAVPGHYSLNARGFQLPRVHY